MTEAEKNEIVGLVMTQISSQAVDFDIATEQPQANDLLTAVRETESGGYRGVTIKWDDVARIATELANQAATRAEQAETDANNILTQVQNKGTEITNFVNTSKTELETQKNESVNEVRTVYQGDLNELKGDLENYIEPLNTFGNDYVLTVLSLNPKNIENIDGWVDKNGNINSTSGYNKYKHTKGIKVAQNTKYKYTFQPDAYFNDVAVIHSSDANGTPTGSFYVLGLSDSEGNVKSVEFTIPNGVEYICVSRLDTSEIDLLIGEIDLKEISPYELDKMILSLKDVTKGIITVLNNKNTDFVNIDGWVGKNNIVNVTSAYKHTRGIKVNSNTVYRYTYYPDAYFNDVSIINSSDIEGTPIDGLSIMGVSDSTNAEKTVLFTIPNGIEYITLTRRNASTEDSITGFYQINLNENSAKNTLYHSFNDKVAYFLGDSICAGDEANYKPFSYWMSKFGIFSKCINLAKGGSDWAYVLNNQLPKIQDYIGIYGNPDYIFISCGTNDFYENTNLGVWFTESESNGIKTRTLSASNTVKGYINRVLSQLHLSFPNAKIILMCPLHKMNVNQGDDFVARNGVYLCDYRDAYIEGQKYNNYWLYDSWTLPQLDPHIESQRNLYWTGDRIPLNDNVRFDGVHLNSNGQKVLAKSLVGFILNKFADFDENNTESTTYFKHEY